MPLFTIQTVQKYKETAVDALRKYFIEVEIHIFSTRIWEHHCERPCPRSVFRMLGQTHVNVWSRIIASQNGGSTSYIFPFKLRILQWSRHLFNY